jgi:hypothetical protein
MNDHIPDTTKMISDTPRMQSALLDHPDAGFAKIWQVGCDIERELTTANERIKRLEEALDCLTLVVGLTPIAGNKDALQEAVDLARAALRAKEAKP